MTLPGVSVRRPVLALVASAIIVVVGVLSFQDLPLRRLPDVDPPIVSVSAQYPGANSEVVENRVTQVIEEQLSGIAGIETITSSSVDGRSNTRIQFELARDLEAATNDVRDAVGRVQGRLPVEVEDLEVEKQDADARPIMWFSLVSAERSVPELTDYARRYIVDRLSVIDGVSFVRVGGGQGFSMRIWLDRQALAARGLTVADVETALRAENVELPAGEVESGDVDLTVRVSRNYVAPEQFARLPIATGPEGHVIRLEEVADVELGPDERRAFFQGNGVTRVGLGVVRQSKANELDVAREVRAAVNELRAGLPPDLSIDDSFDSTVFVRQAIQEVWRTLFVAAGLVILVIFLFLGSLRAALVPAVVVPVALVGVFALLALFGFSVNILTLLAMVLAIGLVVDDSIVVLENIQRRVDLGEPRLIAADRGANQVFFAVVATTAVIIAVFAPLAFLSGYVGRIFVELALTVSGTVAISSFVALTLSPMMCSKLLAPAEKKFILARGVDAGLAVVRAAYCDALRTILNAPGRTVIAAAVIAGAGIGAWAIYNQLDSELAPVEDTGAFFIRFTAPEGASFDHTVEQARKLEEILLTYVESGEVQVALIRVPGFGGSGGFNTGISIVVLAPFQERDRHGAELAAEVNARAGALTGLRAFGGMRSAFASGGSGDDVQFVIGGDDYELLDRVADDLIAASRANPNLMRVRKDYEPTAPRTIVEPLRERAAALGVSNRAISQALETQLGGRRIGTYVDRGEEYDVILQNRLEDRRGADDLSNIFVRSATTGQLIPLSNLVALRETGEARERPRVNRLRAITVSATLADGYSLGEAVAWFEAAAQDVVPVEYSTEFVGGAKEFLDANNAIYFAFGMALLMVFLVLAAQFESFVSPFVIMLTVPLAALGGLFGLLMAGSSVNIYSQIGLIILIGLAAKNGILIVEFANQLREQGRSIRDAVLEAADVRFRPIVMTGVSTSAGAIPLVLASGAGAESRVTIGVVIFSGVLVATLFTLLIVPLFYDLLARFTKTPGWTAKQIASYERGEAAPAE